MAGALGVREVSSALFNNDKMIEVVLELDRWRGVGVTTRELARTIGIADDLVKKVILRLLDAGLVKQLNRVGGRRGPLPYEVQETAAWRALVDLATALKAAA
ncbi:hypothetical protein EV189_0386 [Motilibacter rhizosphaerae]|uniref:Uncharacterized protein n=1 Tax=Motilibacter rhizosphaerae TaxID=598652 RepID=A0A4Q7NXN1_9ACTN|nr:hypothetical protein [Motilibacter rhizosphaerae]RZS91152.1 hypothetical protein EV189_0386 [Motilibacter rhizosphaerae]